MTESVEVVAQSRDGASEREFVPWNRVRIELRRLQALVVDAQRPAKNGRRVHRDDGCAPRIRIDVDERVDAHVESAFLARLAGRGDGQGFTAVDVAAGKHPLAISGFDGTSDEHDA